MNPGSGKALIFGAGGQDAHYLAATCRARAIESVSVSRAHGTTRADVADFEQVSRLVREHQPSLIFQLAAASKTSHEELFATHASIATGTLNVLEAAKRFAPSARVFVVGSGVQFENRGAPISERDAFAATSPYAIARIHSVQAARYYRSLGLRVYVGYLFHHESPLRGPGHVSQLIAQAVRRIAAGSSEVLELGDVEVEKEWTFAGDVVEAMLTLVGQDSVWEAAIGSGKPHRIRDWLQECFGLAGLDWRERVHVRNDFKPEYTRLVSDPRTMNGLGWRPLVDLSALARMMVGAEPV